MQSLKLRPAAQRGDGVDFRKSFLRAGPTGRAQGLGGMFHTAWLAEDCAADGLFTSGP
jgi:hypothetical protein